MKCPWAAVVALCLVVSPPGAASLAHSAETPHPAIVRIIAAERDGASLGSGALVANDASHGLVVTNWHVVRDATGPITVVFPDGFRSGAIVLKTDRDWDLAALAIQRPRVDPLPLATDPPRPGETLTISGYGSGSYRSVTGRCAEYHRPRTDLPAEIVEVNVPARFGDSGGPIRNSRGEIAGVLFGANGNTMFGGYTMGSYCGRVRRFLAAAYVDFQRVPGNTTMLAQAPAPLPPPPTTSIAGPARTSTPEVSGLANGSQPSPPSESSRVESRLSLPPLPGSALTEVRNPASPQTEKLQPASGGMPNSAVAPASGALSPVAQLSPPTAPPAADPLPSRAEQVKTVLAVIGVIAIVFHGMRLLGASAE